MTSPGRSGSGSIVAGTLIYDADCGFCTRSAGWLSRGGRSFPIVAWQALPDLQTLALTVEDVTSAAYWQSTSGALWRGGDAIGMALRARSGLSSMAGRLILTRPVRPLVRVVYRRVAQNRHRMPGGSSSCRIPNGRPDH